MADKNYEDFSWFETPTVAGRWSQDANWGGYRNKSLPQDISELLYAIGNGGDDLEAYSPNRALMPYSVSNTYVNLLKDYPKETVDKAFRAAADEGNDLYTQYEETTPIREEIDVYWPLRKATKYGRKAYRTPANGGEEIDLKLENLSRKYGFTSPALRERALKVKAEREKAEQAEMLRRAAAEFNSAAELGRLAGQQAANDL